MKPEHWSQPLDDLLADLDTELDRGLSSAVAAGRLREHGPNRLRKARTVSAWRIAVDQFRSLIVALLAAAVVVSIVAGQTLEAVAIAVVLVLNAVIGFVTEIRAVRSMEGLRRLGQTQVRVRRDGDDRILPAVQLVPGDVVPLEAGDIVAADLRLARSSHLQANESALTGESAPVGKRPDELPPDTALADRANCLFQGTVVTRGSGLGVVVATGMSTELGRIAELVDTAESEETPLEKRLERLGRRLVWITLGVAVVTAVAGILRGRDVVLMIETGIALAVAAVPEGLPIVATLALARGMWRMARHQALINRLSAVETLGSVDVILTDKTGTLTENRMTVARWVTEGGEGADRQAMEIGSLCNNASLADGGSGDPLEVALLDSAVKAGVDRDALLADAPRVDEEAFDPDVRMMATVHRRNGSFRVAVKGAPETVLDASRMDDADRERWMESSRELAAEGLRVLALAQKEVGDPEEPPYRDLTFVGLVAMHDPPRADVAEALASARDAGVRVVMVTGDLAETAQCIGCLLHLTEEGEQTVTGRELPPLDALSPEDKDRLRAIRVFARVEPAQKLELVALHQEAGSIVAMTGDGVNDAPALKKADIGIAMGLRGTEVARQAADMVLRDDAFSSIVHGIRHGRIIFRNIRRFVVYLLSCNLSEIAVVLTASLLGTMLPLLPLQILYLNLVTDVFPALALGFGEGDPGLMRRPPRDPREPILTRYHWGLIGGYAVVITVSVMLALELALHRLELDPEAAVTVSFLTLALAQLWHVFTMRDPHTSLLGNDVVRNPWVWGAIAICLPLLAAAVYVPGIATALHTRHPGLEGWGLALGMSLIPLAAGQAWLMWGTRPSS